MDKKNLYEYLDAFNFINKNEIYIAINDYFMENFEILNPSRWELREYQKIGDEYIKEKNLKLEDQ